MANPEPLKPNTPTAVPPKPPAASSAFAGLRVSLMPSELGGHREISLQQWLLIGGIVIGSVLLVIGIGYGVMVGIRLSRSRTIAGITAQIEAREAAIVKAGNLVSEVERRNRQVRILKQTVNQHVRFTRLFAWLEGLTQPGVRFGSFSGDADNAFISLDAQAVNYEEAVRQVMAFRNDPRVLTLPFNSVSAKLGEGGRIEGAAFALPIKFDPKLLYEGAIPVQEPATEEAAVSAAPSAAAEPVNGDCGQSASLDANPCFLKLFETCSPGRMTLATAAMEYRYEIIGRRNQACQVRSEFVKSGNADWIGKEMTCGLDNNKTLPDALLAMLDQNYATCEGPLLEVMKVGASSRAVCNSNNICEVADGETSDSCPGDCPPRAAQPQ
ncbi:hypothetical protein A3C96_03000 [Candidatus Uhrbacteria bacterium RIFCSPHIGHO2_02_FULL_60_10]|uniref:Uncharacterized protein n=1 Tax=Candidatus Uhrbacteria bacterium RIFCSPHIGHO2_02_FULL_60_10 TaxID=1802392 RepID=A0A1F7U722_9BACT|nr:MAG: hypothetical protein A3C96_03000 [Candidatus Uhrbacteria bacterium RIFCSPHIGHO2_02_FULL_60_10]